MADRLIISGAREHNLCDVDLELPRDRLIVFSGLSGSGSQHLSRPSDGKSFEELAPRNFSFNSPYGACTHCDGLGTVFEVDAQLVVPDPEATIAEGAISPWAGGRSRYFSRLVESVCKVYEIPLDEPWQDLTDKQRELLLMAKGVKDRVQVRYNPATYTSVFDHIASSSRRPTRRRSGAICRGVSRSTSRVGAARPAGATARSRSRCTSCPTPMFRASAGRETT